MTLRPDLSNIIHLADCQVFKFKDPVFCTLLKASFDMGSFYDMKWKTILWWCVQCDYFCNDRFVSAVKERHNKCNMQTCKERFYKVHIFETVVYLLVQRQELAQIFFFKSQEIFCMTEVCFMCWMLEPNGVLHWENLWCWIRWLTEMKNTCPCCGQYINQGFAKFFHSIFKGIHEPSGRLKIWDTKLVWTLPSMSKPWVSSCPRMLPMEP